LYCLILVGGTDILSRNVGKNNNLCRPVLEKNEDLNHTAVEDRNLPKNENIKHLSPKILAWLAKVNQRQGHEVVQLIEELRYKPEDCGFNFRWCHCDFSIM
jgi:hypothetical protein